MSRIIILLLFPLVLFACKDTTTESKQLISDGNETKSILEDTVNIIDTTKLSIENTDTQKTNSTQNISTPTIKPEQQERSLVGVSDNKLNGQPILIQLELAEKVLADNPDTIKNYLKAFYLNQEQNFPRSIADNFEQGVSIERIHYPKLNFIAEVYKNEYEKKPYEVLRYSLRKENEKIIVE